MPQRGYPLRLMEMAARNAEHAFFKPDGLTQSGPVVLCGSSRSWPRKPTVSIECYDISIFQGEAAVVRGSSRRWHSSEVTIGTTTQDRQRHR